MIRKIRMRNWRCISDRTLEFKSGRNLICGPNASGKSSVLYAICFSLTGETPGIPLDLQISHGADSCEVEMEIEIGGRNYRIFRRIESGKRLSKHANLYCDGNEICAGHEDVNKKLADLLGFGEEYFIRAIFMKEGDVYEYLSRKKRTVPEEIDKIVRTARLRDIAMCARKIRDDMDLRRRELSERIESAQKIDAKRRMRDIDLQISELVSRRNKLAGMVEQIKVAEKLRAELEMIEESVRRIGEEMNELRRKYGDDIKAGIESKLRELESMKSGLEDGLSSCRKSMGAIEGRIQSTKVEMESLLRAQREGSGKCPTCEQPIGAELISRVIEMKEGRIREMEKKLDEEAKKEGEIVEKLSEIDERLREVGNDARKADQLEAMRSLVKRSEEIRSKLKSYEGMDAGVFKREFDDVVSKLDSLQDERRKIEALVGEGMDELVREFERCRRAELMAEAFHEACEHVISRMMEMVWGKMRDEFLKVWKRMFGEMWDVEWTQSMDPVLLSGTERFSIDQLSGGQKMASMLATRVAMARTAGKPTFMMMDEPTLHLDEDRMKGLMDAIELLDIQQLIVASSDEKLCSDPRWNHVIMMRSL